MPERVQAAELAELLAGLEPIGFTDGATTRLAWTPEDQAAAAWSTETAGRIGLQAERDPAGNPWACPETPAPLLYIDQSRDAAERAVPVTIVEALAARICARSRYAASGIRVTTLGCPREDSNLRPAA